MEATLKNLTKGNSMKTIQDLKVGMETKMGRVVHITEIGAELQVCFARTSIGNFTIAHEIVTNDSVKEL